MSKRIKRKYTTEFKLSAVNMDINSDKSVAQVASDLGVNVTTLYTWVNNAKSPNSADKNIDHEALFDELKRLKKELAEVKEQRDILRVPSG